MSDPFRFTTIAHAGRALLGPLAIESVDLLLSTMTPTRPPLARVRVLDVGCGKGEILLRAIRRFDAMGTGVEPNPAFAADALARAHELGLAPDLVVHELPFDQAPLKGAQFDVALCTGAAHAFGDVPDALQALGHLVPRGGWALFGCGYWKRRPAQEYLDAFGGSESELRLLEDTVGLPAGHGWTLFAQHESSTSEWDDYESGYAKNMRAWLAANASDPDADAFRRRIESWNGAYERWGRETMGFVTLVLKR
jgi:SAM-dependent methyltransferase